MSISHTGEGARSHTPALARGMRDGIPVGLGYLAVAFSLGIAARNAGLNAFQGFLVSLLNNASAGEYAGFTTIAADATYLEIAIVTLIANARYLLMSCSLSQKFAPGTPMRHRLLVGYDVTDELFGLAISYDGRRDSRRRTELGRRHSAGRCGRQPAPRARGQRAERCALRHVPRHHHPAGAQE